MDMETEDTDIEVEGGNALVWGREMEIVPIADWVASAASASDVVGHPFAEASDWEGSVVVREELVGTGEGAVDIVVAEIRIESSVVGDTKMTKVAGKMTVAAVAVADLATDGRLVGAVIVKGVDRQAEIVEHAAEDRKEDLGSLGCLEHSVPRPLPQSAAGNLDFR